MLWGTLRLFLADNLQFLLVGQEMVPTLSLETDNMRISMTFWICGLTGID